MFPSQGFFVQINCPDYLTGKCSRVYCHLYHNPKLKCSQNYASSSKSLPSSSVNGNTVPYEKSSGKIQQKQINPYLPSPSGNVEEEKPSLEKNNSKLQKSTDHPEPLQQETGAAETSSENNSEILQQLISEAVKKVLSENSKLSPDILDQNSIIKSLDTHSIITKAVTELSNKPSNTQTEEVVKEKKPHRLYLPPPGTPSYKPTPISELKCKTSRIETDTSFSGNEEYTPTTIINKNEISTEGDVTDFSNDEEDEKETRSEFDMLEEVLVERSSDPLRKKAILKRKKALGKLSAAVGSKYSKEKKVKKVTPQNQDSFEYTSNSFRPPSPIFTSSSEANVGIQIPLSFRESNKANVSISSNEENVCSDFSKTREDFELTQKLEEEKKSEEESKKQKTEEGKANEKGVSSAPKAPSHNLLPQIAALSRPNVKSWSPVAKVDSLLSVEKMLEQLDSISSDKRSQFESSLEVSTGIGNQSSKFYTSFGVLGKRSECISKEIEQISKSPLVDRPLEENEKEPNKTNLSENSGKPSDTGHGKRSLDEDISSDMERKRRKIKKSHHSRRKSKKRKKRYSSSEDESYTSESEEEDSFESSENEQSPEANYSKRSRKHKKRKSKSLSRRSKHKKYKDHKKKSRSRSKSSQRRNSLQTSTENSSDGHNSVKTSCESSVSEAKLLLSDSQIKKEKIDVDISIVKIEKETCNQSQTKEETVCVSSIEKLNEKNSNLIADKSSANSRQIESLTSVADEASKNSNSSPVATVAPATRSMFDIVASSIENSKPKVLKEISIFENLPKVSPKKVSSHRNSNSDRSSTSSKSKESETKASERKCASSLLSQEMKQNAPETQSPLKKQSSHTSHKNKDNSKASKGSHSKNKIGSDMDSNELEKQKEKSSQKEKSKSSNLHSKSSSSSHSDKLSSSSSHNKHTSSSSHSKPPSSSSHSKPPSSSSHSKPPSSSSHSKSTSSSSHSKSSSSSVHSKSSSNLHGKSSNSSSQSKSTSSSTQDKSSSGSHSKSTTSTSHSKSTSSSNNKMSSSPNKASSSSHKSSSSSKNKPSSSHSKSSSSSRSKSSGNTDSKGSKRPESEPKKSKEKEKERKEKEGENKRKSQRDSVDEEKLNKNIEDEMNSLFAGSESPIPDLSALDDLPKEDWDQLLSGSIDRIEGSEDSDEADFDPSSFDDADGMDDPKVLEECMRVFSEYTPEPNAPPVVSSRKTAKVDDDKVVVPPHKARVAYSGAAGNLIAKPKALIKPRRKTPAEVMLERYKRLKEEEQVLQRKLEQQRKELERHGTAPPSASAPVISSSSVSSTSDAFSPKVSSSTGISKKRVARAPSYVSALLKSKAELKALSAKKQMASASAVKKPEPQTLAMTNAKGSKRVAHIPKMESLERPIVSTEEGTKVPQNIRQRYLNCFIDETLKFCDGEEHAFNVALAEESICHKRATTRMVYLNLAVNVLKRLRTGTISEAATELLESDPKYKNTKLKTVSACPSVSSSKKRFEHPINPNHRTVSHFAVMASGGQKGTWSIQNKKSLPDNINEFFSGTKFYKSLTKYILSVATLEENCFPRPDPSIKGKAILKKINNRKKVSPNELERYCDRCSTLYEVDQWGLPVTSSSCVYHWGRAYKRRVYGGFEARYSCCQGDSESGGCCLGTTHVSENFSPDTLRGYVRTIPKDPGPDGCYGIYALDCEMCYTTAGNELTRITVVDTENKTVYESFVVPDNPIIDYNTRFSGITAEDLQGVTVSLRDVQAALLTRFSEKTILMGHSLESDFSALKLIHDTVVDTSVVFPHKLGPPFKRALRNLASEILTKIIQNDEGGHDSAEDAITCMQLMQWRVKEDLKGHF